MFSLFKHNIPTFQDLLPKFLHLQGYNTKYLLFPGFYKPNAIFFLEPSFLSQYISLAIIIEILYFKRYIRIFTLFLGLLLTLSGTGWLLLLFGLIVFAVKSALSKKTGIFPIFSAFLLMVFSIFLVNYTFIKLMDISIFDFLQGRIKEFFTPNTSAHMRFIAPYVSLIIIDLSVKELVFGFGAGSVKFLKYDLPFEVAFTALPKIFLEYGILASIAYLVFISFVTISNSKCTKYNTLSFSLLFMNLFLSGSLLQPHTLYLMYFLLSLYKPRG
jgi:hypothetical protein